MSFIAPSTELKMSSQKSYFVPPKVSICRSDPCLIHDAVCRLAPSAETPSRRRKCSSSATFLPYCHLLATAREEKASCASGGGKKRRSFPSAAFYDRPDKITSPLITVYANNDKGDGGKMSC